MKKNQKAVLGELLAELKAVLMQEGESALTDNEDWTFYTNEEEQLDLHTVGLIADPVDVDEEEWEEILPDIAVENDLLNPISAELIDNVLINALHQSPVISEKMLVKALNYYIENDDFMKL